jgi:hypothetical protein
LRRRARTGVTCVLAAVVLGPAALAPGAAAAATPAAPVLKGLHDARYCELVELRGTPPAARADVFSTIGLNRCPPVRWTFDASALAKELGATRVVLDGPRRYLVDSAQGVPGPRRGVHGLALRRVARIPVQTAADLVVPPFTDQRVVRDTVWRWNTGRRIYELVAPGGDTYVMQSYAQTVEPSLQLGDLRRIGPQLGLPEGWRYRTRVLRRPLALAARGSATLTHDALGNTYQLATTVRRGPRVRHTVSIDGTTAAVPSTVPGAVEDHGRVTGTPFGAGTLVLVGTLADGRLTGTARLTYPDGSIIVALDLPFTITGNAIRFRGTSRAVGGTGAYRGITSGPLTTADDNTLDGQNGVVHVTGSATY